MEYRLPLPSTVYCGGVESHRIQIRFSLFPSLISSRSLSSSTPNMFGNSIRNLNLAPTGGRSFGLEVGSVSFRVKRVAF